MYLEFIEEDSLLDIKSNISHLLSNFCIDQNNWLTNYFKKNPFLKSKFYVNDFTLDMHLEKPYLTDYENVKRVYSNLNFLSDSIATDERLWAGLCLGTFWNYTQYRWKIKDKCTKSNIIDHYFFGYATRRSITRNALARLWWIGRLTYDSTRKDPFELTKFVCSHQDIIFHILERTVISNNKKIMIPFLDAIIFSIGKGKNLNTDKLNSLSKYLNLLGGIYLLDILDYDFIYDKIIIKIDELT